MTEFLELLYWRVLPHSWQDVVFYVGVAVFVAAGVWTTRRLYAGAVLRSQEP